MSAGWTSTRTRNPLVSPQHCRVRPLTFCSPIVAALAACVGWCDGWGVQDADGRRRIALQRVSRRVPQRSIDGNDGSITIPWGERGANRTHRRTIVRTHAPLAPGAMVGAQRVDDHAAINVGQAAALGDGVTTSGARAAHCSSVRSVASLVGADRSARRGIRDCSASERHGRHHATTHPGF